MPFIAFKVKNYNHTHEREDFREDGLPLPCLVDYYNHTHEREDFRALCEQLKKYGEYTKGLCVLIANYNVSGCELDAILIKRDGVVGIELKDYGGKITAVENWDWAANDTVIKGGGVKPLWNKPKSTAAS